MPLPEDFWQDPPPVLVERKPDLKGFIIQQLQEMTRGMGIIRPWDPEPYRRNPPPRLVELEPYITATFVCSAKPPEA